jgi:ribosomal-protein-serine acetyltransferase
MHKERMPAQIPYSTTLADDWLLLRAFDEQDIDPMLEAALESREQLARWMAWCTPDYGRAQAEGFVRAQPQAWREGREYCFIIVDRLVNRVLGSCGLNRLDWPNLTANLGYWIRTSEHGKGAAKRAVKLVLGFAFAQLGLQRVEIVAAVANVASQRVAEKSGAKRESLARNRCRAGGIQQDAFVYSVIPSDMSSNP